MFMPKKPISVTLEESNLLWLQGRAASTKRRSLSEALDAVLSAARAGGAGGDTVRSVAGTVDISEDDPDLLMADAAVTAAYTQALSRPFVARETAPAYKSPKGKRRG